MNCTRFGMLGLLTFLPAFAQVSSVVLAEEPAGHLADRHFGIIRGRVDHIDGSSESTNWSGYAVLGSAFTSAHGSWVVPAVNCTGVRGDQYSAFWVGLDGYSSSTVEQTGTLSDCTGRSASYAAWYEFYPAGLIEVNMTIRPGDHMSASVVYNGGNSFTVTITDVTTGRSFTKTSNVSGAARSSAEWIAEAPCCTFSGGILPLANFGTVKFGEDSTGVSGTNYATDSTNSGPIVTFTASNTVEINKIGSSSSPQTSTCSALSQDGTSFSCTWAK